jgi:hypothetical protein
MSGLTHSAPAQGSTSRSGEPDEEILDPDLIICDPHHHLWDLPEAGVSEFLLRMHMKRHRYLLPELLADLACGHRVMSTVFVDARAFYRATGPVELRPVGETEFVSGVAAMSASGRYGPARVCSGMVCRADLTLGGRVEEILLAHSHVGGSRFKGIRHGAAFDPSDEIPRNPSGPPRHLYMQPAFRDGFAVLRRFGLSFESNFPVDEASTSYRTLWNAFKHIAGNCSTSEKHQLFREVAESFYRIETHDRRGEESTNSLNSPPRPRYFR